MIRSITILLIFSIWIAGCANQREAVVSQGGITCIKPPPEIFTTAIEAQLDASAPKLGEIAKANVTAKQKIEKLRETLPEVHSFEVLEYRFCRMYANGLIDKPTYNDMVKQVLPQLGKKPPFKEIDETTVKPTEPKAISKIEAYCGRIYHRSTNSEPGAWKGTVAATCPKGTSMVDCQYWAPPQGNGTNDVASGPTRTSDGMSCKCDCQHGAKEGFLHSGAGHWCGCYPVAVCASEPINLPPNLADTIKIAIANSPSCK